MSVKNYFADALTNSLGAKPAPAPPKPPARPPIPGPAQRPFMVNVLLGFAKWVNDGKCKIRDKYSGEIRPLRFNNVQRQLLAQMLTQAWKGKPIRVLVPKARKQGISTFMQALGDYCAEHIPNWRSQTVAHRIEDTREIFGIAKLINQHGDNPIRAKREKLDFPAWGSRYACDTISGNFVGSGATYDFLHVSELAKAQTEAGFDAASLVSMISAVPQMSPRTIVVLEGTGQGPTGTFFERCMRAFRKESEQDGDYALCFFPWFADPNYRIDLKGKKLKPEVTEAEQLLMSAYGLDEGQIAWRRHMLREEYAGNEILFQWDYPANLEECFAAGTGRIYPTFDKKNIDTMDERKLPELYRAIDWGWAGKHNFVCLWIAHEPNAMPRLIVNPSCTNTINEHIAWRRDPKTGRPLDVNDHTCDALRYAVSTFGLTGLVYVYRELVIPEAATLGPANIARAIHEASGWRIKPNRDRENLMNYQPGDTGEVYKSGVADRSGRGWIKQFGDWGIPTIEHMRPELRSTSHGEIEDGIALVTVLVCGDANMIPQKQETAEDKAVRLMRMPIEERPHVIEQEVLEQMTKIRTGLVAVGGEYDEFGYD